MTKETLEKLLAETQKELEDLKQRETYNTTILYETDRKCRAEGYQEAIREVMELIRDIFARKDNG